jgi:hypothetical protein
MEIYRLKMLSKDRGTIIITKRSNPLDSDALKQLEIYNVKIQSYEQEWY